jgi:hypothetical protein
MQTSLIDLLRAGVPALVTLVPSTRDPGADRASQLLGLMRRFFGLIGGGDVNGRAARG